MLQGEHSTILSTFIKLPIVIKIFVLLFLPGHFTQVLLYICSEDPGEMQHNASFHQGLHCL